MSTLSVPGNPGSLTRFKLAMLNGGGNALSNLAILLTLGLVAFAPLGVDAARVGIAASFATVIAGGLIYAWRGSVVAPTGGPSSATALILAGLVMQLVRDPELNLASAPGLAAVGAVAAASVVLMGLWQLVFALLGLGRLARFVPQTVLAGFMNGVALMIILTQVPALLGLPPLTALSDAAALARAQPLTLAIGLTTAAAVWLMRWKWPRIPALLLVLSAGTGLFLLLGTALPGMALGPAVGPLPQGWVLPDMPLRLVAADAFALLQRHAGAVVLTAAVLAVIASLESLLGAVAVDQVTHTRHDTRRELIALGLANLASGVCGGLPLVLSRSRALLLVRDGVPGRGAVVATVVAFVIIYAIGGPVIAVIPKAVLAGITLTIAVSLVDVWTRQLLGQLRAGERSSDLWLSLTVVASVCAATVAMGFVAAVAAGVLLSMGIFIRSMNRSLLRGRLSAAERPSRRIYGPEQEALLQRSRQQVTLLELEGALFFGSAERLAAEVETLAPDCRCLVLDLRRVNTIDESGAVLLQELSRQLGQRHVLFLMAGVAADNAHGRRLKAFGCFRTSPRADWWPDVDHAIEAAERMLLGGAGGTATRVPLAQTSLLHNLEPDQLERMMALLTEQPLPAGALLFREGDPGDCLYLLTQGSISILSGSARTRQRFVSFSPGVMFGEVAMLDGSGRSADAVADSDSVVYVLTRAAFDALRADEPVLGERLMHNIALHLSERLRSAAVAWRASAA